ncbi:protein-disulfide reductase DsbD [Roseateles koreensis]|uniref:Thiol:disulfide interchange protein DsbD n=1 Tax=Roseateles koreensis TaxID=2987526 RepID=A0ABT5KV48_9BURK|nr:protein-disulfide reductase DsbD [Roseateles koreensis]MDC8786799.1 protein-disulfide reductase DsbD [Roseateles koreensis]
MTRTPTFNRLVFWIVLGLVGVLGYFSGARADDFLEPEQAFKLHVQALDGHQVLVTFDIAPGYYMYREQFKAQASGATLGEIQIPAGKSKFDETFQKTVEIYRDALRVPIVVSQADGKFKLTVSGQGCADKGLCYPPMTANFELSLADFGGDGQIQRIDALDPLAATPAEKSLSTLPAGSILAASPVTETGRLDAALQSGHFWSVVGVFFVAGLLLSLTPCVLPMLPILSSIIVGSAEGKSSRRRGLLLAVSYSLGMALIYTALGVAAGLAGEGLAATLQKPWVLSAFALALVAFSLSMFGAYELQLPSGLSGGLSQASQRLPAGRFVGVFAMGGVSALIVSPCVAAPLAGALLYLSQTRDVMLGGSALFALACGMSVPLLLLGASAGSLLPRAGAWMDEVKHFFGMLLLAVALWTVQPILPEGVAQALWGALLIGASAMLGLFQPAHAIHRPRTWLRKTAAVVSFVFGLLQLVGAASGGTDPLKPLAGLAHAQAKTLSAEGNAGKADDGALQFQRVHNLAELDAALASAGKPVLLDFYADWCVSCKEMERFTFSDPTVRQRLHGALLLKVDVTDNSLADRALLKRFKLFGPPGTVFFDAQGQELPAQRVIGFQGPEQFLSSLKAAGI